MSARFTNICPPVPSHWAHKETATIYDTKTRKKIASVLAYPHRTRKEAKSLARHICDVLNAAETAGVVCHFTREQIVEAFKIPTNGPDIDLTDEVFKRSPYMMDACNGGNCERHDKGAEPCTDCPYCDEEGNI